MFAFRAVVPLVVLAVLAAPAFAEEKPKQEKKEPLTEKECGKLAEQLVNPDKPPFTERYVLRLPKGISEDSLSEQQEKIRLAYNTLSENAGVAMPVLMKYIGDERFSYAYEEGMNGTYHKKTVGGACRAIIYKQVELYDRHTAWWSDNGPPWQSMGSFIYDQCGGLEKWWEKRKDKSLADLQTETLEWAIRQPQPKHFKTKEKWDKAVKAMEQMAEEIRCSKKPLVVDGELGFFSR